MLDLQTRCLGCLHAMLPATGIRVHVKRPEAGWIFRRGAYAGRMHPWCWRSVLAIREDHFGRDFTAEAGRPQNRHAAKLGET